MEHTPRFLSLGPRSKLAFVHRLCDTESVPAVRKFFKAAPAEGKQLARAHRGPRADFDGQLIPKRLRGIDNELVLRPFEDCFVRLPRLGRFSLGAGSFARKS